MARKRKKNGSRGSRARRGNRNRKGQNGRQSTAVTRYAGSVFGGRGGFPPTMRYRAAWDAFASFALGATSTSMYVLGNGAFQPGSGSGFNTNSPFNFTKFAAMYNNYRVYASSITARVGMSSTNVAPTATLVGGDFVLTYATALPTTGGMTAAAQQPGALVRRLGADNFQVLRKRATSRYVMANDPSVDESLQAPVTGNPSNKWYWNMYFANDAQYTGVFMNVTLRIVYDIEFYEVIQNIASVADDGGQFRKLIGKPEETKGEVKSVPPSVLPPQAEVKKESPMIVHGSRVPPTPKLAVGRPCAEAFPKGECKGVVRAYRRKIKGVPPPDNVVTTWVCTNPDCPSCPLAKRWEATEMKFAELQARPNVISDGDTDWYSVDLDMPLSGNEGPFVLGSSTDVAGLSAR